MDNCSKLALAFANALVAGAFDLAHDMLADAIKAEYSSSSLQQTYQNMINYFLVPPALTSVEYRMDDWQYPPKQTADIGWAYVSIHSDCEGEGVTVIVCKEQDRYAIRHIEWGRP